MENQSQAKARGSELSIQAIYIVYPTYRTCFFCAGQYKCQQLFIGIQRSFEQQLFVYLWV